MSSESGNSGSPRGDQADLQHTQESTGDGAASWTCERQDEDNGDIYWAIHDAQTYAFIANVYSSEAHAKLIAQAPDLGAEVPRLREQAQQWATWGVIEIMVRNPNVDSFVRKKEAEIKRLQEILHWVEDHSNDPGVVREVRTALSKSCTPDGDGVCRHDCEAEDDKGWRCRKCGRQT